MSICCKTKLMSRVWLLLACGAAVMTTSGTSGAADLSVKPYLRSYAAAGKPARALSASSSDITGTVNSRSPSGESLLTAAVSQARAARARFNDARHALDHAMLLREAAPKRDLAMLEAAMKDVFGDLAALERTASQSADVVKKAGDLAQDWYAAGLKIVKPPAEGVTELPLPMKVRDKADAVAAALDQVIEQAMAEAPPPAAKPPKRRAATRPHPATTEVGPAEMGSPVISVE